VCNKHDGELHGGEDSIGSLVLRSPFSLQTEAIYSTNQLSF